MNGDKTSSRKTSVYITVIPRWLISVYKRGLAVVDGRLVIAVINTGHAGRDEAIVIAGDQDRNGNIRARKAVVRYAGGAWHLEWFDS